MSSIIHVDGSGVAPAFPPTAKSVENEEPSNR